MAAVAAPTAESAPPSRAVLARSLERQGRLSEALRVLEPVSPKTALGKHAARLRVALRGLGNAAAYRGVGEYQQAQQALRGALRALQPGRDVFVAAVVHRRLQQVAHERRADADAEAREILTKAAAFAREKQHDKAAETYKLVAERKPVDVSPFLIRRAKIGQIHEEAAALTQTRGRISRLFNWIWSTIKGAVEGIAKWVFYLAVASVLVWLLIRGRRRIKRIRPQDRTTLSLEDLSASADERNVKNRTLTQELLASIGALGIGSDERGESEIDESIVLDGTLLVNLGVVGSGLEGYEATIHDETPLKLGPLSFNPRQVFSLGVHYFSRRSKNELKGTLLTSANASLLTVDLLGSEGSVPEKRWAVRADGPDSRATVIKDMATRIVFDLGGSLITAKWASYREYRTAMERLDEVDKAADRSEPLQAARLAFQRSLDHDPGNLLARFNLSNTLRKLGEDAAAVEHYGFLQKILENPSETDDTSVQQELLRRHPEFPLVVRYNRAVALSKIPVWDCHNEAISELDDLIGITSENRRLQLLAWSAWAKTLVFKLEQWRGQQKERRLQDQRDEVIGQIESVRSWIETLPLYEVPSDWTGYVSARAAVQGALGRAYYLVGRFQLAHDAYERALSMVDLGETRMDMASLLIRRENQFPRWAERAEDHLGRALILGDNNKRAHYLLGLLYMHPISNRIEQAKKQLRLADDARALLRLSEIDVQEGDLAAAVADLRRAIRLDAKPDYRFRLYIEQLFALNRKKRVSIEQLEDAIALGQRYVDAGSPPQQVERKKLIARLKRSLASRRR